MAAVKAFAFKRFRQARKDHRRVSFRCGGNRAQELFLLPLVQISGEALHIAHPAAMAFGHFQRAVHPDGVDVAGAAALIARRFGKAADVYYLAALFQRQHTAVLQKHGAFLGQLCGDGVVAFQVQLRGRGGSFVRRAEHNVQNADHSLVQRGFTQGASFNGGHDLGVIDTAGTGHFQVKPSRNTLYTVSYSAPVGHHKALKVPLGAQDIGQQHAVFAGKYIVHAVVAAHHRPGLGFLDGGFKCRQVNFAQRTLRHVGRCAHAAVLLAVGGKMLDGGTNPLALYAIDVPGGQLTGQHRVFGVIFKVAAAQRAALDVYGRPQHNANAERAGFPPDGRTLPAGQVGVKAGGNGAPGGEADRLAAVVGVVPFRVLGAQAVRAVRDHQGGNAQAFHGFGVPEIRAGAKPGLFFQRELGNQFGNVVFHQKVILLLSTSCGWGARAVGGCSGSGNVPDTPFRPRCLRGVPKWTHTPIFCIIIHHFAREKIAFLLKNVKSENFFCAGCWCVWPCISPLFRVKFKIRIYSGKNVFLAVFQGGKNEKR